MVPFSSYPPLSIPNSLHVLRLPVYNILSKTEHVYLYVYIPSLTLFKCILLSKMPCSNSQEQKMERIRNARFTVYQALLSSLGEDCVTQHIYCFACTWNDTEEVGYGRRNEDWKKKKKRPRGLQQRLQGGSPIKNNGSLLIPK